jgi:hypothetical protein
MKKRILFFIISFVCSISLYAQQNKQILQNTSQSIYTFNTSYNDDLHSAVSLKKKLGFLSFEFFQIYMPDLDFNSMVSFGSFGGNRRSIFEFKNMKKKPDIYKMDDLVRYQNNKLAREINYKNDPSQWNLHRKENRIQPYFLQKDQQN